ncbi:Mitotic spindle-associated MMXD complex subunit MIP18 [Lamprotornis superbus]|uniref:Mitotic spindle-associated MMXD complex subunit MIP18 n=3 Tax=Passeriformes TaxID=9126 RepID=A0A835NUG3_9PASS|nr:Mitotic spindle-associated MMXD complex subunit MIP18 [Lamprotornis superbus]
MKNVSEQIYERVEFALGEVRVRAAGLLCLPQVNDAESTVSVEFTPTIPHCSMATLIGLSIKVKLLRSLPERFKLDVHITPGTHASEHAVNKQLADKERVAAALENSHLLEVVNQCLSARSMGQTRAWVQMGRMKASPRSRLWNTQVKQDAKERKGVRAAKAVLQAVMERP